MSRKIIAVIVACGLLVWLPTTIAADGIINKFAEAIQANPKLSLNTCQTKTGATKADIESLKLRKMPQTKTGRCFLQCLFSSVKLMDDGRFSKQGMVVAFAPATKGDLSKVSKLRKLSEVCEREIGRKKFENCQGVKKIVDCVAKNGQAYGIEFDKKM